ncbi:hypothetical protein [Litchfieldia salsa]|uniref:Uncharacterized protein n=1 Tax=Litchfieldia salsa TaxID=930152 RepID=A0A1H0VP70_9BACI|nr:hypothetical protein [Litchfieldia salsa]SDP79975.1 hypothetical protein SAMN05216565_10799 [Litchfieldia salsa]
MHLELNAIEIGALTYHLNIMRIPVKKGFKKTYGSKEGKVVFERYDSVSEKVINLLAGIDKGKEELESITYELELDDEQVDTLKAFLDWYSKSLLEQTVNTGVKIPELTLLVDLTVKIKTVAA